MTNPLPRTNPGYPPDLRHYTPGHHNRDWMARAACRDHDPELWFPNYQRQYYRRYSSSYATQAARQICLECPVRLECLHYALTTDTRFGIWAGTTESERAQLTGKKVTR